jgi:hypothetical protein
VKFTNTLISECTEPCAPQVRNGRSRKNPYSFDDVFDMLCLLTWGHSLNPHGHTKTGTKFWY